MTEVLLVVVLGLQIVIALSKWRTKSALQKAVAEARAEAIEYCDEAMELLRAVRDMATSARDNRKETAVAVERVKEQLSVHPTHEDIVRTLEDVSEKTAAKVVQKLPASKDDWRGHEHEPK